MFIVFIMFGLSFYCIILGLMWLLLVEVIVVGKVMVNLMLVLGLDIDVRFVWFFRIMMLLFWCSDRFILVVLEFILVNWGSLVKVKLENIVCDFM